jgi:RNA polymerase sigma-70 factor (ECF subfamily)
LVEIEATLNQQLAVAIRDVEDTQLDAALARRIASGDTDAWDQFFDRYAPWAYRFAYRHLAGVREDAEDLCSDILLTAAKSVGRFDPRRGDLDAWMYGLARHRLSRFCRGRKIELPLVCDTFVSSDTNSSTLADKVQTKDLVNRALASLPERQATALIGMYVEGYSTDELARIIGVSPKAVESLLVRARTAFRSAFAKLGGDIHE